MTIYTDPFGGSAVTPAEVSYASIAFAVDTSLAWPADSVSPTQAVFARIIDATPAGAGLSLTLPDATRVSNGWDGFFRNLGASDFTVKDFDGNAIATVTAGTARYIYLIDNSTDQGTWRSFVMGAGASAVDAASLAGLGLVVLATKLNTAQPTNTFAANQNITDQDRAAIWVWNGGVGTLSLPSLATVDSSFFFSVANQGTGVLTIAVNGADTIDGAASLTLQPTESAIIAAGPATAWYSLGRGRSTQFDFTLLTKAITGGAVVLTANEASNVAHKYTGALLSNATITLPSVVQVYYVSNQTTGAFTVTFKTAVGGATTIAVPQGQNAILVCDGSNVINASTTAVGLSTINLAAGTVGAPSLQFPDSSGLYQPASSAIGVSIAGVEVARFNATGVQSSIAPTVGANLTNKTYVDTLTGRPRLAKSANYTIALADKASLVEATANTFTFAFDAVATLGSGWWCIINNTGSGDVTLDPNGAETIDGLANYIMYPGEARMVQCDGAALRTIVLNPFRRRFDANGTFTKPPGYQTFRGYLWGGGGAGGKHATGSGAGGGGGACVPFDLPAASFGATETVTIAAVAAGVAGNTAGTNGNNSTLGTLVSAFGGGGGGSTNGGIAGGGGGGGASGAGTAGVGSTVGLGGLPAPPGGTGANGSDGFGGSDGNNNGVNVPAAWGGAGGGRGNNAGAASLGSSAVWGGGGGGGGTSAASTAGTSKYGGAGGAGGNAGAGSPGVRPGGGGGGTITGATSGDGAGGRLDIWGA